MKNLIISLTLGSMVAIALAPAALANNHRQVSSTDSGSLTELVRHNRDARAKK